MRTRARAAERGQAPNIAEWHVFAVSDMASEPDDPPGIKVELGARRSGGLFGVVLGGGVRRQCNEFDSTVEFLERWTTPLSVWHRPERRWSSCC
jgi:hypothetical protein